MTVQAGAKGGKSFQKVVPDSWTGSRKTSVAESVVSEDKEEEEDQ